MIVLLGLLFCGKCQMEPNDWSISEMNKFSLITRYLGNFGEISTISGLKDKNLPKFCKMTTIFNEFFEVFDLSDLSKIRTNETFAISHDAFFPKLTICLHTKFSVNS